MKINKDNYPYILKALQLIDEMNLGETYQNEEYSVGEPFDLEQINRTLSCLSREEFDTFVNGADEDIAVMMSARPSLDEVDQFLMAYADGEFGE